MIKKFIQSKFNPAHWRIDGPLCLLVLGITSFGLLMLYSSSFLLAQEKAGDGFLYVRRQGVYALIGIAALVAGASIPYRRWLKWGPWILFGTFGILSLVFIPGLGARVGGATRWVKFGGGFGFQPGEVAKLGVILFVAGQLERKRAGLHKFTSGVLSPYVLSLPIFVLLLLQPDFGSTVILSLVIFALIFLAGVPKRFLSGVALFCATAGALLIATSSYRRERFMAFLDPWRDPGGKGFQILQSLIGFHQGHLFGVGLGNGKEKLFYLPEAHNDFLMAVVGEELGFIGVAGVVVAFTILLAKGLKLAADARRRWDDLYSMLLAAGITLLLATQAFVNIAVVMGLLPTKGLNLPFLSYGGSALIVDLFAIGILLNLHRALKTTDAESA